MLGKVGDQVQQGQVLANVDTSALQQQLASLQGQLAQSSQLNPMRRL